MTAHWVFGQIVIAFVLVLAVAALAIAVEWERRERRRMAAYRKRLIYRDARKPEDIAWHLHLDRVRQADRERVLDLEQILGLKDVA